MPKFGDSSQSRLLTCDPRLQYLCNQVIKYFDFSVTEGHRTSQRQRELYAKGRELRDGEWVKVGHTVTNVDGVTVRSKHNAYPSLAVDVAPYPIDYSDREKARERFYFMMGMFKMEAERMGIKIRFGLDWDSDGIFDDQNFDDLPHIEIVS